MTPILFEKTETEFSGNGIGRLVDATKCEVTEERNGMYELVLQYPVNGKMFNEIQIGRYITANHDESRSPEPFQIYRLERPLEGFITVRAWHISYLLNYIVVEPFTAVGIQSAIAGVKSHSINSNPFSFWTDKTGLGVAFYLDRPATVRSILGGTQGSLLDYYGGGEYEFSGWTVKLYQNRGANHGVSIRYGKNLTKLDQQLDASNVYDSVVPYWSNGETSVYGTQLITRTGATPGRAVPLDVSSYFDEEPTVEDIEAAAQDTIDNSASYTLKENLKIDFVALWQTEEYKQYANLERVRLCDTVNIYYAKMDVNVTAKVIKVVYDSLRERYTSIELGEPTTTLSQQIRQEVTEAVMPSVPTKGMMQGAIDHATELISGGFGGYIKYNYLADGTPSEMLIMDSPSEATATNIIRLNQNGLGFSTDGGATYANAWTIDGQLVADFITTGTLNANVIRAGIIQDADGDNYWDLEGGEFVTQKGQIANFNIEADKLSNGTLGIGTSGAELTNEGLEYTYKSQYLSETVRMRYNMSRIAMSMARGQGWKSALIILPMITTDGLHAYANFNAGDSQQTIMQLFDPAIESYPFVVSRNAEFMGDVKASGTTRVLDTPSDFIEAETNFSISSATLAIWGKLAQLTLTFTLSGSINIPSYGNLGNFTCATLKSGYRPANNAGFASYGDYNGASGILQTDGSVRVCSFPATGTATVYPAGTEFTVAATYLLA